MEELVNEFKRGFLRILEILRTSQLTDFKRFQLESRLVEIASILNQLSDDANEFIEKYFTKLYIADLNVFNEWMDKYIKDYSPIAFGGIHLATVKEISEESYSLIARGLQFTYESSRRILRQAIKETMLKSEIEGITLEGAKKILKNKIEEIGLNCLIDRGGKKWELPTYSEMVLRTQTKKVHREVTKNAAVEAGYDAVIVQSHPDCCEICSEWNGKILSLRSEAPDWADGTLEEAELDGLFHPNCRCVTTPYLPNFGSEKYIEELIEMYEENE